MSERCPKCKSADFEQQTMGWHDEPGHRHDPNRRRCVCGHTWYLPCPVCGPIYADLGTPDAVSRDPSHLLPEVPEIPSASGVPAISDDDYGIHERMPSFVAKLGPIRRLDPSPGPLEYRVVDEAANVWRDNVLTRLGTLEQYLKHADTCPCPHCAHLRAESSA